MISTIHIEQLLGIQQKLTKAELILKKSQLHKQDPKIQEVYANIKEFQKCTRQQITFQKINFIKRSRNSNEVDQFYEKIYMYSGQKKTPVQQRRRSQGESTSANKSTAKSNHKIQQSIISQRSIGQRKSQETLKKSHENIIKNLIPALKLENITKDNLNVSKSHRQQSITHKHQPSKPSMSNFNPLNTSRDGRSNQNIGSFDNRAKSGQNGTFDHRRGKGSIGQTLCESPRIPQIISNMKISQQWLLPQSQKEIQLDSVPESNHLTQQQQALNEKILNQKNSQTAKIKILELLSEFSLEEESEKDQIKPNNSK